jgi:hypothetical protein
MFKHYYLLLCITLVLISLVGCLVDQDNVPQVFIIDTNNLNLHTYQSGDWITYEVSGNDQATDAPIRGQLAINWSSNPPILKPLGETDRIDVLKETSVLSINTGPDEFNNGMVRYVSQESTDSSKLGTYYVHAYDDVAVDKYFWLSSKQVPINYGEFEAETVPSIISPLATSIVANAYTYWALQGCDGSSQCNSVAVAQIGQQYTVGSIENADTSLGRFEAYRINFSDSGTNTNSAGLLLDIRHFCAARNSVDIFTINSSGKFWVHPEVGIIKYDFFCLNLTNNETTKFIASISGTNITLPEKK